MDMPQEELYTMSHLELTPDHLNVLTKISEFESILVPDLTQKLGMDRGKVEGCLATLIDLELIQRKQNSLLERRLTKRGLKAAKKGLSERQILEVLSKGPIHIKDLGSETNIDKTDFTAGIGILKKAQLIKIEKGHVSIANPDDAGSFSLDIQNTIEKIRNDGGVQVNSSMSNELEKRGFIEIKETSIYTIFLIIDKTKIDMIKSKKEVTKLTPQMLANGSWRDVNFKPYSLTTKPRKIYAGRYHPYRQFLDHLRLKLIGLGFQEMKGPLIEQEFWNFDALFAAQDHASREDSDILLIKQPSYGKLNDREYVKNVAKTHEDGWKTGSKGLRYRWDPRKAARLLLRPQGTSISARTMSKINNPPAKYFSIARNFRPDQIDATHDIEFDQTEGIICDPSITFRDLLGMLKTFAIEVAGATKVRFRPDYYPFTTPSVELSAEHPVLGRVEFGGSGIFRPEVTQPFGIDYPVLAYGIGVGRLFMTKYKITDIRELFSQKLDWLRDGQVTSGIQLEEI